MKIFIENFKAFFVFIILHRRNKIPKEALDFMEQHWSAKPTKGISKWIYDTMKKLNNYNQKS